MSGKRKRAQHAKRNNYRSYLHGAEPDVTEIVSHPAGPSPFPGAVLRSKRVTLGTIKLGEDT